MIKRFLILTLITALICTSVKANLNPVTTIAYADNWGAFYSYLAQKVEYPANARSENHQGNSIITFTVSQGNLKNLNVKNELGKGCDLAVLNSLMAYPQLKTIKEGNYALKIEFRIQGSNGVIINELVKMPTGFTSLNTIHIVGSLPLHAQNKIAPAGSNIIIRGAEFQDKNPLYVVNGKVSDISMNELDPNTIESVNILKDASATALYGKEAQHGVLIITTKEPAIKSLGIATEMPTIKLRGKNTLGLTPLYVLDGNIIENAELNLMDPNNIQSITILKDAASVATYGPQAQDGVIIITSKKEASKKK